MTQAPRWGGVSRRRTYASARRTARPSPTRARMQPPPAYEAICRYRDARISTARESVTIHTGSSIKRRNMRVPSHH